MLLSPLADWPAAPLVCLAAELALPDARVWGLLFNSFWLGAWSAALAVPLGTLLALALLRTNLPGRRLWLVLLAGMLFVPLYLQTGAWDAGFGMQGWFTFARGGMGSPPLLDGWRAVIFIHAVYALPWVVLIVGTGLVMVPPELEEEALLAASPWQVLWRVTLPQVSGWLGAAAAWVAITTAAEMTVTNIYLVRTYTEELYTGYALSDAEILPTSGWPAMVMVTLLMAAALWMCHRLAPRGDWPSERRRMLFRLGRWRWPAGLLVAAGMLLYVGVPLGNMVFKAGVLVEQEGEKHVRHYSAAKSVTTTFEQMAEHGGEIGWSLTIAAVTAVAVMVIAAPLAWQARRGGKRAWPALVVIAVCLALPAPMIGLAVIKIMNQPSVPGMIYLYDRTIAAPVLALVVRTLPAAILVLWYAARSLPESPLEAAATEGAGPLARWWHIGLPQRAGALAVAGLVTFALALGDLAASILVLPPGMTTLSVRVFSLIHYGVEDEVAALCLGTLLLYAVVAAAVVGVAGWNGRFGGRRGKMPRN